MSTRVNVDELDSTRTEKFLAVVLTAFLLVGTVWFYVKVEDWAWTQPERTAAEQAVIDERNEAQRELRVAKRERDQAGDRMEVAREDYRVALEAGNATRELESAYRESQRRYEEAGRTLEQARQAARAARTEARQSERAYRERTADEVETAWVVAAARLGFILVWLTASYRLIVVQRRRESRYQPVGFAVAATGVMLSLVYTVDYVTEYIDPLDMGPIVLSLLGAGATLTVFVWLQRYLAGRIPGRRVRKGECPFCGYPVRDERPHCEGCGREVIAPCAECSQARRVGSRHCGACGVA